MSTNQNKVLLLLSLLFLISCHTHLDAQTKSRSSASSSPAQVIESGKFRIYELKQVQGEESYEIRREPGGRSNGAGSTAGLIVTARFDLPYWGEEKKPSL